MQKGRSNDAGEAPFDCANCMKREFSALASLNPEDLSKISDAKACAHFKKGDVLMSEGSRPTGVYCIHNGKVKLSKMGTEGKDQILRFAHDGDILGYRSLLSGETLSATIQALDETHACFIPKAALFDMIETNPKFSLDLMKMACHELGEAGKIITNLAQKTVKERLAEVLLIIHKTFGENSEGELDISLTREEIANMVGTATESVIRLLSEFKEEGYIELKGRRIKILDAGELAFIGNVED
jgi:CRP-like cAMP-binding protein